MTFFLCLGLHCYCSSAIPDEANSQCHAMPFDSFNPHPQHCLMDLRLAVLLMCELMASWCRLNDGLVGSKSYWMYFEPRVFLPKEPVKNPNGSIFMFWTSALIFRYYLNSKIKVLFCQKAFLCDKNIHTQKMLVLIGTLNQPCAKV